MTIGSEVIKKGNIKGKIIRIDKESSFTYYYVELESKKSKKVLCYGKTAFFNNFIKDLDD